MLQTPAEIDLVLVGGGHAHVQVLRRFAMQPVPGVRVTVVSRESRSPYSGMLPGHIAGHYTREEVLIDLPVLAARSGARFVHAEVAGLDPEAKVLHLTRGSTLGWDLLSINSGSTPETGDVRGDLASVIPVKPISAFLPRLDALLARVDAHGAASAPLEVAIVGGGPGGIELALALHHRLAAEGLRSRVRMRVIAADESVLERFPVGVGRWLSRALDAADVAWTGGARVAAIEPGRLVTATGASLPADETLWVTQAAAPSWIRESGLECDPRGFLCVGPTLQSVTHPDVFAAGDIAALTHAPREKSGVFAVRAGPTLARNLQRAARGEALTSWRPQRRAMYLISTGDRRAIVARDGCPAIHGGAIWRWKDWIDRRFMTRFSLPAMDAASLPRSAVSPRWERGLDARDMRCRGCGSKLGDLALREGLGVPADGRGGAFEDAARVEVGGAALLQTMDGFPLPFEDLFLSGRVATLHALGDAHAMGVRGASALAFAAVQTASAPLMSRDLAQLMAGVRHELESEGCELVGGHSCETPLATLALAITAEVGGVDPLAKTAVAAGDALICTKPLGTGVLMAALAAGEVGGEVRDTLLAVMLHSNRDAIDIARRHGVRAATDVTGFGLLGHAREMIAAGPLALALRAPDRQDIGGAIPFALDALSAGRASSLQEPNEAALAGLEIQGAGADDPRVRLLCDPQTAGGLLFAIPSEAAPACLADLRASGYVGAWQAGTVEATGDHRIEVVS